MPKPRIPTEILEARGAFKTNPARGLAREGEPKPTSDIGDPPARLTGDVLTAWNDICRDSHPGVLSAGDRTVVEVAAVLLAGFRAKPDTFAVSKLTQLLGLMARFGMTPADRSRVKARSPEKQNKFTEIRNRARAQIDLRKDEK